MLLFFHERCALFSDISLYGISTGLTLVKGLVGYCWSMCSVLEQSMTSWSVPTMKCLITTAGMVKMLEWLALVSNFVLNHHCPKIRTTLVHNTCMYMYFSQLYW